MNCLVSVIITAYNQEDFIEQAIDSVIEQNHKEFECIISDDGSDDKTSEIYMKKYSQNRQIRIITQKMQVQAQPETMGLVIYLIILNI